MKQSISAEQSSQEGIGAQSVRASLRLRLLLEAAPGRAEGACFAGARRPLQAPSRLLVSSIRFVLTPLFDNGIRLGMVRGDKTERIALRLSADEARVVAELSAETGLSISDVVRQAIRTAHAERFKAGAKKRSR
jgi:hypothetical protein